MLWRPGRPSEMKTGRQPLLRSSELPLTWTRGSRGDTGGGQPGGSWLGSVHVWRPPGPSCCCLGNLPERLKRDTTTVGFAQDGWQASLCDGQRMGRGSGVQQVGGGRSPPTGGQPHLQERIRRPADMGDGLREHAGFKPTSQGPKHEPSPARSSPRGSAVFPERVPIPARLL